ncbi:MAG: hypothetical protein AABZ61_01505, partial [Bacteroidota bacterium]
QARFQAFNSDGKARLVVDGDNKSFEIIRPLSKLSAWVVSDSRFQITQGVLEVPADKGIFPYIETSTDLVKTCTLITICLLNPIPVTEDPKVDVLKTDGGYRIHFKTHKNQGTIGVKLEKEYPTVDLQE